MAWESLPADELSAIQWYRVRSGIMGTSAGGWQRAARPGPGPGTGRDLPAEGGPRRGKRLGPRGTSTRPVLVVGPPKPPTGHLGRRRHEPGTGERRPELGVGVAGVPGFQDGPEAAPAAPVGLGSRLVAVEEGAAEGGHRVDGTPAGLGQEGAGAVGPARRHQGPDAGRPAPAQDQGAG